MALLAMASLAGALLEAFFLVIVTAVAMALVAGQDSVGPILGQTFSVALSLAVGAVILVIRLVLNLAGAWVSASLTARVTTEQRNILAHTYLRTSWAVQQAEPAGRLQALLTGFVATASNAVSTLATAVTALLSLLAFLATGLVIDALSTVAVLIALGLVGAIMTPLRRRIRRRAHASAAANLEFAHMVSELGSLGLEMQTYGVQSQIADIIDELTKQTTETQRRVQVLSSSLAPVYMALAYAAVLAGVALLTVIGFNDLGVIGAVMLLMLRSLSYGQQLSTAAGALSAAAPYLDQIKRTIESYDASPAAKGEHIPAGVTPIEASQVEFAYASDRPALTDASFRIDRGEIVGVIGPSGAGKSTLAQLLLGLREPVKGSLRAGGIDLRQVDRDWWSRRVGFVAQDALLFTGTVAENIRFFRDRIDDATVRRAAAQANVLADIEALPEGFDTHLGERGSQLSGGQRQRLSIARALAGDPELIVLDEPTSALDGQSEALIRDTLAKLKERVTVVIIAHRMSTLDICDRIMVIQDGRISAFDTPAALRKDCDFYQNAMAVAGISGYSEVSPCASSM